MEHLLTHKTVSLTELRDPAKVLEQAGSSPVAVLNRNKVVGYFVPVAAVEDRVVYEPTADYTLEHFKAQKARLEPALEYLKDK